MQRLVTAAITTTVMLMVVVPVVAVVSATAAPWVATVAPTCAWDNKDIDEEKTEHGEGMAKQGRRRQQQRRLHRWWFYRSK